MKIKIVNFEKHVACPPAGTIFRNPNGSGNVHMVIGGLNEQLPLFNQYHYVCIDVVDSKSFHKLGNVYSDTASFEGIEILEPVDSPVKFKVKNVM